MYGEIFVEDVYRQHGITIGDGQCIFDVGANTGLFEVFLNTICRRVTVYAFEPVPAIFEVLERNVALCPRLDVHTHAIGLSRQSGEADLFYFPHMSCASTMHPDESPEERERARQYILRQFDQLPQRWLSWILRCCLPPLRRWIADRVRGYYARKIRVTCPLRVLSEVIRESNVEQIDLLSIDIDGNDYWVWKALHTRYRPRVLVMEYNAAVAGGESRTIAYDPGFRWSGTDYFGASLLALERLSRTKGYTLVYCEVRGINAFFVRSDICPYVERSFEEIWRPADYARGKYLGLARLFWPRGVGHRPDQQRRMIDI